MSLSQLVNLKISEFMVKDVISFAPETRLGDVATALLRKQVSGAPITDGTGKCVGVISVVDVIGAQEKVTEARARFVDEFFASSDLVLPDSVYEDRLRALGGTPSPAADQPVSNFMVTDLVTVSTDDTLGCAIQKMLDAQIHRVIATDASGRLQGIVSTTDILALILREAQKPSVS